MEFIFKYMNIQYDILTSQIGNDGIYRKNSDVIFEPPINGDKLVIELVTIFNYDKELIKNAINDWAKSIKHDVDLRFFWITNLPLSGFTYLS